MSRARPAPLAPAEAEFAGSSFAIVCSRFNEKVTEGLLAGALRKLAELGVPADVVRVHRVPGAWELPQAAARVVAGGRVDAVIALGCVIRGETPHFDYVSGQAARGLGEVALSSPIPVTFGVLTTDTGEQALARSGAGPENKGYEAAAAAVEMMDAFAKIDA